VELDARLPALLQGKEKPANAAQQRDFAWVCLVRGHTATAARLYQEALTGPVPAGLRLLAAMAAARAGCRQGVDTGRLDDQARERWRKQALGWLRAELELIGNELGDSKATVRGGARRELVRLRRTPDLAGVREDAGLARLPAEERQEWRKFWAEVEALGRSAE
jgi:hypothetical protein